MRGRRSLVISQTVLFASTLGVLKFSNDGEALIDNLPEVSWFVFLTIKLVYKCADPELKRVCYLSLL